MPKSNKARHHKSRAPQFLMLHRSCSKRKWTIQCKNIPNSTGIWRPNNPKSFTCCKTSSGILALASIDLESTEKRCENQYNQYKMKFATYVLSCLSGDSQELKFTILLPGATINYPMQRMGTPSCQKTETTMCEIPAQQNEERLFSVADTKCMERPPVLG